MIEVTSKDNIAPEPCGHKSFLRILHVDEDALFLKSSRKILEANGEFQVEREEQ